MNSSRWRYETKSFHPTRNKDEIEVGSLYNVYQLRISDSTSIYTCLTWYNHDIHRFRSGMCVNLPLRTCSTGPSQLRLAGLTFSARKRFPVKIFRKIQIHPNIPLIVSHLHIQLRSQHPICKKNKIFQKTDPKIQLQKSFLQLFSPGTYFGEATKRTTEHVGLLKHFKSFRWNGPILEPRTVTTVSEL